MRSKQTPSPNRLVVRIGSGTASDAATLLAGLGNLEPLPGSDHMVLEVKSGDSSAKGVWRRVLDQVKRVAWAAPVVLDEAGAPHYPTGGVSVRFREAPTAKELERFARVHRIRIRGHNEFVPQQLTVEPLEERERYLPELVEEISAEEGVLAAWADTVSEYKRH